MSVWKSIYFISHYTLIFIELNFSKAEYIAMWLSTCVRLTFKSSVLSALGFGTFPFGPCDPEWQILSEIHIEHSDLLQWRSWRSFVSCCSSELACCSWAWWYSLHPTKACTLIPGLFTSLGERKRPSALPTSTTLSTTAMWVETVMHHTKLKTIWPLRLINQNMFKYV